MSVSIRSRMMRCAVLTTALITPSGLTLSSAPDMRAGRASHSATTLLDGRVLIAGGFITKGSPIGAELFDPQRGQYQALPPMVHTRHSHTATRLPDGRVLLVGGYTSTNEPTASAELFDPRTNSFSPTGTPTGARADHIAVLLSNGKVLLAGGLGPGWTFLSSAEVYDPATGRFTATGSMTTPRESHVAVALRDGRVLVVGGHRGRREQIQLYASAEAYDVASGVFTHVADMRVRRHKHDAVLLRDGRVLITGGSDERDFRGGVYTSTEFFDPTRNEFTLGPSMKLGRYKHRLSAVVQDDGRVVLAGGAPQAELFDPVRGTSSIIEGPPRMAGQFSAVAPLAGGGVLITGGYGNGTGPRASSWRIARE